MATAGDGISLRPLSLRPGGGTNPFKSFGMGAGVGFKHMTSVAAAEKRKPRSEVIQYAREFLMKFAQANTQLPAELQMSSLDILQDPNDPNRVAQRALFQHSAADDADERDWRAHTAFTANPSPAAAPAPPAASGPAGAAPGAARSPAPAASSAAAPGAGASFMSRAADAGKLAWAAGTGSEGSAATVRKVKGILNKLTPEKFERLLSQFIPLVTSYEVLSETISQVFESAVAQPTFVAMYADLCAELDAVLPEFDDPASGERTNFRKMLANTCQAEYEASGSARAAVRALSGLEREEGERRAKQRLLGCIRLIAQLFCKGLVNDRVMSLIVRDLLGAQGTSTAEPSVENVEAACELLSTAGAALEAGPRSGPRLDAVFAQLTRLAGSKNYPARVRFAVRDVVDLRRQRWVPRREVFTAKKLDEVRAEAAAELGLDVALPGLDGLGGTQAAAMGMLGGLGSLAAPKHAQVDLFPAFREEVRAPESGGAPGGGYSAFVGEFRPVQAPAPAPAAASAPAAPASSGFRTDLTDERRESLARSVFSDFLAEGKLAPALDAARELAAPAFLPRLVEIGARRAYEQVSGADAERVAALVGEMAAAGLVPQEALLQAARRLCESFYDDSMDSRHAPAVLGELLARLANPALAAEALCAVEETAPRRAAACAWLRAAAARAGGEAALAGALREAGVGLREVLSADEEFDGPLPTPEEFLREEGLAGVLA